MQGAGFLLTPTAFLGISAALLVLFLFMAFFIWRLFRATRTLEERQKMFLKGKDGADLEAVISRHDKEIGNLDTEIQELFEISEKIRGLAMIGIHKVGIVRFNPFQDTGGNQSWSIALLNGSDTGLVISSLLSRESARVYAKPVIQGHHGDFPLTAEEKRAIELARKPKEPVKKAPNSNPPVGGQVPNNFQSSKT